MPLINIVSNKNFTSAEKIDIAKSTSDFIMKLWNVLPDKIGTQITKVSHDEISRGGICPVDNEFSKKSRKISLVSEEYYSVPSITTSNEYLLNITIDTWTGFSFADKTKLAGQITRYFDDHYQFSGDNIIIYFRDILPENWFQNGVSGRNPEFLNKSRQVTK